MDYDDYNYLEKYFIRKKKDELPKDNTNYN